MSNWTFQQDNIYSDRANSLYTGVPNAGPGSAEGYSRKLEFIEYPPGYFDHVWRNKPLTKKFFIAHRQWSWPIWPKTSLKLPIEDTQESWV